MSKQRTFEIGDRVGTPRGRGTVIAIEPSGICGYNIGVQHDEAKGDLHNLGGKCPSSTGWWYTDSSSDLKLLNNKDVVVIFDKQ